MSQEAVATQKVGKTTVKVHYDPDPLNPREDWDNLSTFAFFHRRYRNESDIDHRDHPSLEDMREYIESKNGLNALCVPVYLYSHSGDTVNTTGFSCPWDSGQIGFAYVTREQAREWYGWKRITKKREQQILEALEGEVKVFDQFIRGEVYGYEVKDEKGNTLDSCWGYFGKEEYCLEEGVSVAEYHDKKLKEAETNKYVI